ncbi:hypothetical protein NJC40_21760 [Pseudomonas sp. 21LCFQ02]|uniref:hypothetical protein n=1 Tax=Pseudomonas sp. 21LCFQ02 TaxID=2957505 RepID=UPI00209A664B|nr:hypothetical protein [Pseudomonas sp. 21LCFQ02]MCO8170393.1 hypothetical protein [Pseudomonas sp. 21LCFQ02]
MLSLPETLQAFLTDPVIVGDAYLPTHYPAPDRLDDFQIGFRTHGLTGESLASEANGAWHPAWYVIALTGLDDPIFISTAEAQSGYPVYYAPHGAGRWDATQIAPSLAAFARLLAALAQVNEDNAEFERLIVEATGSSNRFWREILDARRDGGDLEESSLDGADFDPADYQSGELIVSDLGPHKLKVVQVISKSRKMSLKETLALAEAPPFTAASGVKLQLRRLSEQLEVLGATVKFRSE